MDLGNFIGNITRRYTEDDLQTFSAFKHLVIFERHEEDTYREELNNLFSTIILLQIFWHEVGHIRAGYVDRTRDYIEFDSSEKGCYSKQEQEMVADWLSTKQVFFAMYNLAKNKVENDKELIKVLQQLVMLYWISLTIEFQIFDSNHKREIKDFSKLSHPYPSVRLLYSIDAMTEAIMDILNTYGIDDAVAGLAIQEIFKDIACIIHSFLLITECPIDYYREDKRVVECYYTLRKLPYSVEYEKNDFLHLLPLDESYINAFSIFFPFQRE